MLIPRTRAGLSRSQLQQHLEQVHGPLVMSLPVVGGTFREYVHYYAIEGAADRVMNAPVSPEYDDLTIIKFNDRADFQRMWSSREYREIVQKDERNFSETESLGFVADEYLLRNFARADERAFHLRRFRNGADPERISSEWRERVSHILSRSNAHPGLGGYIHNRVARLEGGRGPYDVIDEVWPPQLDQLSALGIELRKAEAGLFDPEATVAMITRAKVFVRA